MFQGNAWQPNLDDPDGIGAIVENTGFNEGLIGTSGDDQLFGLDGDDVLIGREGSDFLDGGTEDNFDTADYSDEAEMPEGTEQTLGLSPPSDSITVVLGDFSQEIYDFKVIDRYGDTDYLVNVERVKAEDGAINTIQIDGDGTLTQIEGDTFSFNPTITFEGFNRIEGDTANQTVSLTGLNGYDVDLGGGTDTVSLYNQDIIDSLNTGYYAYNLLHSETDFNESFDYGEALIVDAAGAVNTLDGSSFTGVETFENVHYAHIEALGHHYIPAADALTDRLLASNSANDMVLDYSDFGGSLSFDVADGIVSDGVNSDTFFVAQSGAFERVNFAGSNEGDVFDFGDGANDNFVAGVERLPVRCVAA